MFFLSFPSLPFPSLSFPFPFLLVGGFLGRRADKQRHTPWPKETNSEAEIHRRTNTQTHTHQRSLPKNNNKDTNVR